MADHEASQHAPQIDWEAFYADYRKPDFIRGYEILQKLGAGAFGIVFKARKHSIGKDYAIKFLKVDDEGVRDAVLRELDTVRLFAQIDHPNLVSIEDMGHVDGIPYIVMGHAGEETLALRQRSGPLPRDEALRIFLQVCRGVQALHERMLVHFDLKPANVYLKGDTARVGDYGLSKLVSASRRSLSFGRGTTYYMAPEVMRRQGDHRSDIYSLGVLLYETLVGHVPFRGDSEWEVLKKHETETPTFPSDLAATDRAAIEACLAKDPDDRVQSVGELIGMLQGAAAPERAHAAAARARQAGADRGGVAPAAPPHTTRPRRPRILGPLAMLAAAFVLLSLFLIPVRTVPQPAPVARARATSGPVATFPPTERARATARPEADTAEGFRAQLDVAIEALQRLRDADVRLAEVRSKALTALGTTLRNLDYSVFRGQDPWGEALLQAITQGFKNNEVRARWAEVADTILPPAPPRRPTKR